MFAFFANKHGLMAFGFTWFSFVLLYRTTLLSYKVFVSATSSKCCVEKEAEAKLSMQYIENNLQQQK